MVLQYYSVTWRVECRLYCVCAYSIILQHSSTSQVGYVVPLREGNVLSQSHLLCDLPRDIELAAAAAGGAVASIWPHSLLQLRRVDKSATATT